MSQQTIAEMIPEYNTHIGELVLDCDRLVLFKGCFEGVDDYYYHYIDEKGERHSVSAACWIIFLKGKIDKEAYEYLVNRWNYVAKDEYEERLAK